MPGIETIVLGTAGTPSGDSVRTGFGKSNDNFSYLDAYKVLGVANPDCSRVTELSVIKDGDGKPHLKISTLSDGEFTIGPLTPK